MTFLGWLLVLALIAFFAVLALRLIPIYLEYYKVREDVESLQNEPFISKKTPSEVYRLLNNRLYIDSVERVKQNNIKIVKEGGRLTVGVDYEVRVPLFGNIDVIVHFKHGTEIVER